MNTIMKAVMKDRLYIYWRFKLSSSKFHIFAEASPKAMAHCLAILSCISHPSVT